MSRTRPNFSGGFTLLELLLVLVLIAVMSMIVVPQLSQFSSNQEAPDQANRMVALARWARTQAATRGVSFRLNIDPAGKTYGLTMQNGVSFENVLPGTQTGMNLGISSGGSQSGTEFGSVGEEPGRQFSAPNKINLKCNIPNQQSSLMYIEFYPNGRVDPGTISIIDASGKTIEVGALSASEQFHVLTDDEKQQESTLLTPTTPAGLAR
jgi:prepilin-type N-terminal cleavage/methylation domain-containing protein